MSALHRFNAWPPFQIAELEELADAAEAELALLADAALALLADAALTLLADTALALLADTTLALAALIELSAEATDELSALSTEATTELSELGGGMSDAVSETAELAADETGREETPDAGLARRDALTELMEASSEASDCNTEETDAADALDALAAETEDSDARDAETLDSNSEAMLDAETELDEPALPESGAPMEVGAVEVLEDKLPPRPSPRESMLAAELDALDDKLAEDVMEADSPRSVAVMEAISESRLLRSGIE